MVTAGPQRRSPAVLCIVLVLACVPLLARAQRAAAQVAGEYEVKAAFLYNFAKFIEWPALEVPAVPEAFSLCVLGDDPFGGSLERVVRGKTVQDHPLIVRHLVDVEEAVRCQILFVTASALGQFRRMLAAVEGAPVLIVGDTEDVVHWGGMVGFHMEGNRVRFVINQAAVERAGLQASSQLLNVADKVILAHPGR